MVENKNKKSKYVIVNIKNGQEKVLEFFNDLLNVSYEQIENEYYLYQLLSDEDLELEEIIESLNVDLGENIKVFETNYLNKKEDVLVLFDIYKRNNKQTYSNVSKLTMDISNKDDLKKLREKTLYKIDKDNDLINIVIAMYKNDLNVSKTASSVYMHRNTVINKLEIIKKSSGLDIQKFYDAIAMYKLMYNK